MKVLSVFYSIWLAFAKSPLLADDHVHYRKTITVPDPSVTRQGTVFNDSKLKYRDWYRNVNIPKLFPTCSRASWQ